MEETGTCFPELLGFGSAGREDSPGSHAVWKFQLVLRSADCPLVRAGPLMAGCPKTTPPPPPISPCRVPKGWVWISKPSLQLREGIGHLANETLWEVAWETSGKDIFFSEESGRGGPLRALSCTLSVFLAWLPPCFWS